MINGEEEKQDESQQIQRQGEIVSDVLIRIAAMERLLIEKNIIAEDDLSAKITDVRNEMMEMVRKALEQQIEQTKNG